MSNQVIHKVGICLLARSFILLIAVSGCVGTKAPLDLLEGQSSGGPSSSLIWTTTRAPDVAPAPPNQKFVEQTLSTTRPPSVGATRLGKVTNINALFSMHSQPIFLCIRTDLSNTH